MEENQPVKKNKSMLIKVLIAIGIAVIVYSAISGLISGMEQAASEY